MGKGRRNGYWAFASVVTRCAPRAILLTGSAASGNADFYSDIDMIVYYDAVLPTEERLQAARADIGAESHKESYPRWDDHTCGETYQVGGVECQVGHNVVADMEERTLSLLDGHDPAELGMKAIMGLLSGIPLHGDEIIEAWQARAANFSDRLARGMVEHYLRESFRCGTSPRRWSGVTVPRGRIRLSPKQRSTSSACWPV